MKILCFLTTAPLVDGDHYIQTGTIQQEKRSLAVCASVSLIPATVLVIFSGCIGGGIIV